jgi:protein TonB
MKSEENVAKVEVQSGDFGECLIGGSADEQKRRGKAKRRALAVSIAMQVLGLGALVIAPMLAKPPELSYRIVPPMPLYTSQPVHSRPSGDPPPRHPSGPCFTCAMNSKPVLENTTIGETGENIDDGQIGFLPGTADPSAIPILASRPQPPPVEEKPIVKRIHSSVNPATLVYRVEPVFPALLRQIHRSGKVELHAIIATDGSIQSLEVVSGDPLCVQSALDAVRQWRYRPTLLNGQPVEIDTSITVLYNVTQQ